MSCPLLVQAGAFSFSSGSLPNACASIATARAKYSRANSVRLAVKIGSVLSLAKRMACPALSRKYDASAIRLTAGSGGSMKNSQSPITAGNGSMMTSTPFCMFGSGHSLEIFVGLPFPLDIAAIHQGLAVLLRAFDGVSLQPCPVFEQSSQGYRYLPVLFHWRKEKPAG